MIEVVSNVCIKFGLAASTELHSRQRETSNVQYYCYRLTIVFILIRTVVQVNEYTIVYFSEDEIFSIQDKKILAGSEVPKNKRNVEITW